MSDTRPTPAVPTVVKITSGLLARNSAFNFAGQVASAAIAVLTLPYVIPRLGPERYGVFALIWTLIEYFSVFEFGIGAATTKFVAEAIGRKENHRIGAIFGTSLLAVSVLGLAGSLACLLIAPLLVGRVFNISPSVVGEARTVFSIAAVLVTTTLVRSVLNGLLEAHQRFDLTNSVKIPSNVVAALIPLVAVAAGYGLRLIVLMLVVKEVALLLGYYWLCMRQLGGTRCAIDLRFLKTLLSFGHEVTQEPRPARDDDTPILEVLARHSDAPLPSLTCR